MKISGTIKKGDIVCSVCGQDLQDNWILHGFEGNVATKLDIRPHFCEMGMDTIKKDMIEDLKRLIKKIKQHK